jgi:hypothetical protein
MDFETTWADLRENAADMFGAYPPRNVEQVVAEMFPTRPNLVAQTINSVADSYHDGNVRSPWAVVAYRLKQEAQRADAARQLKAVEYDEPRQLQATKRLIRNNIYLHEEREIARDEIQAALGPLAAEHGLVDEMLELWHERRVQVGWA